MTLTILFLGLGFFVSFFILFLLVLKPAPREHALLEEVTLQTLGAQAEARPKSWVSVEGLAMPFALLRRLFTGKPDNNLVRRLMLAGYRKPAHSDIFLGSKLLLPAVAGITVAMLVPENTVLFFLMTIALTFFLPDFWLNHAIDARRDRIRYSLPDGLDLLSICMEAGLGLDQAVVRVGQELRVSHPDLSQELLQVNFEERAGVPRIAAWKSLAERVNIESVRSFVAMIVQTERFGTSISKSLGEYSEALRTQRRQQAEEMAAKTAIKLVLPLAFFIFPETFIVTVGPAVLTLMRNMGKMLG
jgi:tight adherence protein C